MKKHKPIRTLAQAERWLMSHPGRLWFNGYYGTWQAALDGKNARARTPAAAVEKLRKLVKNWWGTKS